MLRQKCSDRNEIKTRKKKQQQKLRKNRSKVYNLTKTSKSWVNCWKCCYTITSVKKLHRIEKVFMASLNVFK